MADKVTARQIKVGFVLTLISLAGSAMAQGDNMLPWSSVPLESALRRADYKYVQTPIQIALSSIGLSRAALTKRLREQSASPGSALPLKATPKVWEYHWVRDQFHLVQCTIEFDANSIVRRVEIVPDGGSSDRLQDHQILGNGLDVCPYFIGERNVDSTGRSKWTLNPSLVSLYIDKAGLDRAYQLSDYQPIHGRAGDAYSFIVAQDRASRAHLCVTCITGAGAISRVTRTLNVASGVYDHAFTYRWGASGIVKMEASSAPIQLPTGSLQISGARSNRELSAPQEAPANPQAAAKQKAWSLTVDLFAYGKDHGNSLPGQSGWQQALATETTLPVSRYEGFTYVFTGGRIPTDGSQKTLILGYVSTTGGRAVIYGDFHNAWLSK